MDKNRLVLIAEDLASVSFDLELFINLNRDEIMISGVDWEECKNDIDMVVGKMHEYLGLY